MRRGAGAREREIGVRKNGFRLRRSEGLEKGAWGEEVEFEARKPPNPPKLAKARKK